MLFLLYMNSQVKWENRKKQSVCMCVDVNLVLIYMKITCLVYVKGTALVHYLA